jgi:stalled ribosome rescue protein Dom34
MRLVTIKLAKNPNHDPHNKVVGSCPTSESCTDSTGEHHTMLVFTQEAIDIIKAEYHVTRIEEV